MLCQDATNVLLSIIQPIGSKIEPEESVKPGERLSLTSRFIVKTDNEVYPLNQRHTCIPQNYCNEESNLQPLNRLPPRFAKMPQMSYYLL